MWGMRFLRVREESVLEVQRESSLSATVKFPARRLNRL